MDMAYLKVKKSALTFGDQIGIGGYSVVYKATWRKSLWKRQEVAVKRLHIYQPKEVDIMSKLDHLNIVKLLGVVEDKPDFYLILEFCNGGSLREYLDKRQGKQLSEKQLLDWMKQAALPIQYLKKMGVVHKDIKSPNYMIIDGHVLKLTDFGISKELEATLSNATESASVQWMAPELMKDLTLSPTYDIFAYGVVVWELCTTKAPFKGLEPQVVIMRVCRDDQRLDIPANLPKWITNLMKQCWGSDWKGRPSMNEVIVWINKAEAAVVAAMAARQRHILHGLWEFKKNIGEDEPGKMKGACSIAVSPNEGTIAIADSRTRQVHLYSRDLAHIRSLDTQQGLDPGTKSNPGKVAFGSDGTCYVTIHTRYVLMYGVDGVYKGKWPAVSPQHKSSDTEHTELLGLTTDSTGLVLLGEIKQKYISKHKPDGNHVASIKVDIAPYSLAMTSRDDIIINDCDNESVHIVDNAGQLLHTIKSPSYGRWWHLGVACHEDIICVSTYYGNCIHCYSVSGEYLHDISIGIPNQPTQLAFTADGTQLMVSYTTDSYTREVAVYAKQV